MASLSFWLQRNKHTKTICRQLFMNAFQKFASLKSNKRPAAVLQMACPNVFQVGHDYDSTITATYK